MAAVPARQRERSEVRKIERDDMGSSLLAWSTPRARPYLTSTPSIFFAAVFAMISGCRDQGRSSEAGSGVPFPSAVYPFAGCAAVVRAGNRPVCELGEPARTIRVAFPQGLRSIDVPKGADRVDIDGFLLEIRPAKVYPWLDEAKAARAKGDAARARELIEPHMTDEADPIAAGLAEGLAARLEL